MNISITAMMELLYPLLIGAGLFCSARLLSAGAKSLKVANYLLVLLLFCLLVPMWNVYVAQVLDSNSLELGWPFVHSYLLIAPLMYLYLNEIFNASPRRNQYWLHGIPLLIVVVAEWALKVEPIHVGGFSFFKCCILLWFVSTFIYLVVLIRKLLRARLEYQAFHSAAISAELKWSLALVIGLMLFAVFDMCMGAYILTNTPYPRILETAFIVARSIFIVGIILYTLFNRLNLKGVVELPSAPELTLRSNTGLRLSASAAKELQAELEKEMEASTLFASPDLNLSALAAHMGVSTHQLSEMFNIHMNTTFYRYVNEKRINHAKTLLIESPDKSIVDIAFMCGYGSKTTFYDNFKKMCSMTPKEFRAATP